MLSHGLLWKIVITGWYISWYIGLSWCIGMKLIKILNVIVMNVKVW